MALKVYIIFIFHKINDELNDIFYCDYCCVKLVIQHKLKMLSEQI